MCGIAGYVGTSTLPDDDVEGCRALMWRRGPDSSAVFHCETSGGRKVYLVHSRLNIIDLDDRANQPFRIGSKVLIYNGELYNYVELKRELAAAGSEFYTTSDTEVLLRMLVEHGWEGLDRCEGMWAFAVYDEADGSLLLSRDRFAEKPLYIHRDDTGLYFGSEIKFIFALLGGRLPIDYGHLYRYLVNGFRSLHKVEASFFKGISQLEPASALFINTEGEKRFRYWTPPFEIDETMSYDDALEGTRERLIESVKLRLRADVPLAFCLSGGIDSNSLIGIAKNVLDHDVHGFTIVNEDARYDEQEMVEHAVAEYGIRHTPIPVHPGDFLPRLRNLVRQHDAPVYTITYYAHWMLMASIAEHGYRISVSGTAADEIFSGYYDHHLAYLFEVRGQPDLYEEALANWSKHVRPIVRNPFLRDPEAFVRDPGMRDHLYLKADFFAEHLTASWSEPFAEESFSASLLRNRMANELFFESVPQILHEDDLNAMYYSIENRSPYLDRDLFEFSSRIPTRYLVQRGLAKVILRDSMRGIVPDRILDNPRKVGFNAPIFSYLDRKDPDVMSFLLDESSIYEHVHRDKIEAILKKDELPNSESKFLFYFLNSKIFLEQFGP